MKIWNTINTIGIIVFTTLFVACITILVMNVTCGF